jgi:predicted RNase H-like HicB family nuclease
MMEKYDSEDFAGIRFNVIKEIVSENGIEKVIEYAMDNCDVVLLSDLVEVASSIMTKEQLLMCYTLIKDAYDFKIKALKAQNENLKNVEKNKENERVC